MPAGENSFIDIAVLDAIRERFARAAPTLVLSVDLDDVIWANGPGAALIGFSDIESAIGADPRLAMAARRQITATPGYPEIESERPVTVRLAHGLTARAEPLTIRGIRLPDGSSAILLSQAPSPTQASQSQQEIAAQAIAGIADAGQHAAIVEEDGRLVSASQGFAGLGIEAEALRGMAADTARSPVVKRMIASANGPLPCGFARIGDAPPLHLVLVVETAAAGQAASAEIAASETTAPVEADEVGTPPKTKVEEPARFTFDVHDDEAESDIEASQVADDAREVHESPEPGPTRAPAAIAAPLQQSFPLRFVWRTDADGRFCAVSPEFLAAVGQRAEEIVGRAFAEVADALGFDADGEIAALLERRDTWSGRTVYWPVAASRMRAPVDLAALPVYGRERNFEGFRGFGVARLGDAVADEAPDRPESRPTEPVTEAAAAGDPFEGERPALSVGGTPARRGSDKVIRLAERRPISSDQPLSGVEQSAFREIGDRLRSEAGRRGEAPAAQDAEEAPAPVGAAVTTASVSGEGDGLRDQDGSPKATAAAQQTDAGGAEGEADAKPAPIPSAFALPRRERDRQPADTSLVAQLPTPVLILSGDILHFANRAFFDLSGYADLEALGAAGGLEQLFADPIAEDGNDEGGRTLILMTATGDTIPVEAHLRTVPWRGGRALMLVLRDVGDELAARGGHSRAGPTLEELETRVAEMRTILDTATDGVVLIAPDETIRSVNRPAEALFGFDSDELTGKPFVSLFAIESQRAARDYLGGLADNGVASVLNDGREVIGREAQGRFIPLFMTIGKLPGDSGYCAVMRDITHWKRAEEDLTQARALAERASSQKTDFLARISHEIRTPLNAIIGFSELMMDEKFGPIGNDRYRDYLRDINKSGNLVLDLVNDLLDISKIEAGEQEMNYEAVSLNDTLSETVALMQPQANRERVIIRSSFASKLPEIVADLRSIRQIALNLMSNAVRYTQAGGQVIVSTSLEPSGEVVMRVRDTGVGMSRAEIEQALKPFKQINALKRGRGDGTGLGLPLTKAMVEANRARFQITSTPGEGTLVEVTFPSTRVLAE